MNDEAGEDDAEDEEDEDDEEEDNAEDKDKGSIHAIFIAYVTETRTAQPGRLRERTRSPLEAGRCQPKEDEDKDDDDDVMRR